MRSCSSRAITQKRRRTTRSHVEHQPLVTPAELEEKLEVLRAALETENADKLRAALHRVVPTFREPDEVNASQGETVQAPPVPVA